MMRWHILPMLMDLAFREQRLSAEEQLSASRIKDLVNNIKIAQISTIFVKSTDTSKLMQTIAKDVGVNVSQETLFTDS